jgi:hypothetical protein
LPTAPANLLQQQRPSVATHSSTLAIARRGFCFWGGHFAGDPTSVMVFGDTQAKLGTILQDDAASTRLI